MSFRRSPVKPHLRVDAGGGYPGQAMRPWSPSTRESPPRGTRSGTDLARPYRSYRRLEAILTLKRQRLASSFRSQIRGLTPETRTLKLLTLSWIEIEDKPICQRS